MSTLFSHFFTKINQLSPLECKFTEVLDTIALKPKTLYFYGFLHIFLDFSHSIC